MVDLRVNAGSFNLNGLGQAVGGTGIPAGTTITNITGSTSIFSTGTLCVAASANGGLPSSVGSSTNVASNLVINGGTLQYTGGATSTDRMFNAGTAGATLDGSGIGALNFPNPGAIDANAYSLLGYVASNQAFGVLSPDGPAPPMAATALRPPPARRHWRCRNPTPSVCSWSRALASLVAGGGVREAVWLKPVV